jgi:cell wall-associated NlpC family hydrolase
VSRSNNRARHRAACRPATPLTAVVDNLAPSTRRGIAVMASSGLVLTMAATSAGATEVNALPNVNVSTAVAEATAALMTSPTVKVTSDAQWNVDAATAEATPPPPPTPEREPVAAPAPALERQSSAASRTADRAELPGTEPAPAASAEAPAASGSAIVDYARQFLGVPYVWGGTTPAGFDCSGFTAYVYAQFGVSLPRTSAAQATVGTRVSAAEARPGDLVAWPGHVGIYTGNGNNIAARQPGTPLTEGPIYHSSPTFIRVS